MSLAAIEQLLKQTMGLDVHTMGESSILRAIHCRQEQLARDEDLDSYYRLLRDTRAELDALIEEIVVPETWFFRDQRPFEAFRRMVLEEWLSHDRSAVLRILSIPCSTGEEPYSIAMVLDGLGLAQDRFHIDAVDISARNLERARRARYRNNSFRGQDIAFRQRYFTPVEDEYQLDPRLQKRVRFQQGNLLDAHLALGKEPYDVVFCRNLLIYFDRATQDQALGVLRRLLKDTGVLFIGHAEAGLFLNDWQVSSRYPSSFAFRKLRDERRATERPDPDHPPRKKGGRVKARTPARKPPEARSVPPVPASTKPLPPVITTSDHDLREAVQLANQGHLAEAADLCEQHLRHMGPTAEAFYLLGVVREATGQSAEAEGFWRKALYLDPHHLEALTHLALLCERRGERREALLLRQRTERAAALAGGAKS